jgi:transposase
LAEPLAIARAAAFDSVTATIAFTDLAELVFVLTPETQACTIPILHFGDRAADPSIAGSRANRRGCGSRQTRECQTRRRSCGRAGPAARDRRSLWQLQKPYRLARLRDRRFEALIANAIAGDAALAEDARLLSSVPGIGPVGATTLIAHMPELGTLTPRTAAAMTGLAPFNADSDKRRCIRHIGGGRKRVRQALYIAAMTAVRSRARFSGIYQALLARGKPKKVAPIAVARKLIVILNAIMRDRIAFQP